jgi:hypothetical protein
MVKIVSFSMSGLCYGQNCPFQQGWNVSWSKSLVSAWLNYVMVKSFNFSMSRMCHGQNGQLQHGWNVSNKLEA